VLDAGGLVLTCAYNVEGKMTSIEVTTASGEKYPAEVLGVAEAGDVALLKINLPPGKKLPAPPKFGTSRRTDVGTIVAVLGRSEEDLPLTMNAGMVSAARRLDGTAIQTDALVNYGNLGGPLVNLDGEVLGIAAHLDEKSHWRQNCGVSLATTWEAISAVLPELRAGRSVPAPKKPFLGVSPEFGALDIQGVKVQRVVPDSPAARAGIREGDIIVALGAAKISSWNDMLDAIRKTKVGEQVSVRIRRGDQEMLLTVTMGEK
ncbi:MAG: S1C family serine protease, partial [Planctomycetota bacterium]|nr:S1C family serine protease [Planctomycetota bacterium]